MEGDYRSVIIGRDLRLTTTDVGVSGRDSLGFVLVARLFTKRNRECVSSHQRIRSGRTNVHPFFAVAPAPTHKFVLAPR